MPDVDHHLKAQFVGKSLDEALQLQASALMGVSDAQADALERVGIETIFDLGSSWLFANALKATASAGQREPDSLLVDAPDGTPPADVAALPIDRLRGLSAADAGALRQALALTSIRDFALWPPRQVAHRLVSDASGTSEAVEDVHAEALRPRLGEFPTERVYYESLVMLAMPADDNQTPLGGALSLQPAIDAPAGFGTLAVGALLTLSQSWFAKGVTLGHMLHSLALAPGEATRIAVIDWSRRTRATAAETIEETEQLDQATEHSRAISEVQNAVASEMQSGGSMSSGWAKSTSKGKAGGFSVGGGVAGAVKGVTGVLGFGGGSASSSQSAETTTTASSASWSIGNRSVMAEMSQRVNDRTEQHANSVRNRRASAVREVSQSEHEQISTRVVANYNHMHALTVQYYEVVQVYRVVAQLHDAQRVLFVPFELLDFSHDRALETVARFRGQLLAAALNERVASLLLDERGAIEVRAALRVQLPALFADVRAVLASPVVARAASASVGPAVAPASPPTGVLTAPAPHAVRRITTPGPVVETVPGDVELVAASFEGVRVDRVRFDQPDVPAERSTFTVPDTTFQVDLPGGLELRRVTAIHIAKTDSDADTGTMTLHCQSNGETLTLSVPLDLATGTSMQRVSFLKADPANRRQELLAHLQRHRAHYTQAVLRGLDTATLVMLLSRHSWNGRPLADQVEPNPLAVAGNYLVLRAPIPDDESAGIDEQGTTWGTLLREREVSTAAPDDRLVPIPTGGVFAEAVLGRSNSAEKLDITRFWNWQDSPIPLQPPEIAAVTAGTRATAEDLRTGQLGAPVLNVVTPTALPDPAGLSAAFGALTSNLFRDMSGLAGTQALAQAGATGTLSAATEAGRLASANLKTVTDQAVAMGQAAADMWKAHQAAKVAGGGAGKGGAPAGGTGSVSADGARINHGRDMDRRGVSDNAAAGAAAARPIKVTEQRSEFQAAGGGGGGGATSTAPVSRELAFADAAATGVSPALLAGTTAALGGGAAAAAGLAVAGFLPAGVVQAVVDFMTLDQIRRDVDASGVSLQGVNLLPMRQHPHGAHFSKIGLFAWTNSAKDVFVDTDAYFQGVNQQQQSGKSMADAVLLMRGFAAIGVRHEVIHVQQFLASGPPADFATMLSHEIDAYGCGNPPAAGSSIAWLNATGASGARTFLTQTIGMNGADATALINQIGAAFANNCTVLNGLSGLSNADIQAAFIQHDFLPADLGNGKGAKYAIEDLYP